LFQRDNHNNERKERGRGKKGSRGRVGEGASRETGNYGPEKSNLWKRETEGHFEKVRVVGPPIATWVGGKIQNWRN